MSDPDERRDDEPFGLMPGVNENSASSYRLPSDVDLERNGGWRAVLALMLLLALVVVVLLVLF